MELQETSQIEQSELFQEAYRTPVDNNFDIVQMDYNGDDDENFEVKLTIQKSGTQEKVLDLSDLLSGYDIKFEAKPQMNIPGFAYYNINTRKRIISMPSGNIFKDPKVIFALLHEIGHLMYNDSLDIESQIKLRDLREDYNRHHDAEATKRVLEDERMAWANAIRLARGIKHKYGTNLFNLFMDVDDFQKWIRTSGLSSYETFAREIGVISHISKRKQIEKWLDNDKDRISQEIVSETNSEF